jgi:hypothetical protein
MTGTDQHHDHLRISRPTKRRTPKKGRDIGNDIFVKTCKTLI